jgi:hypothetical protein
MRCGLEYRYSLFTCEGERAATIVLQGLGLGLDEARKLARCPLPV